MAPPNLEVVSCPATCTLHSYLLFAVLIPDSSLMLEYNFLLATVAFELEKAKRSLECKTFEACTSDNLEQKRYSLLAADMACSCTSGIDLCARKA